MSPSKPATEKAAVAAVDMAETLSTVPTLTSMLAPTACTMAFWLISTRASARSASSARTRIFSSPFSILVIVFDTYSIWLGPLNRLTTARFCLSARFMKSFCSLLSAGLDSSSSERAYGAEISEMSNLGVSDLPMPSRTVKERITNVNSAGNRNGWSLAASSRSSPMFDRICLRRSLASSLERFPLKVVSYLSPSSWRCWPCTFSRSANELRKNCAVRFREVMSPPGTRTPMVMRAWRHLSTSRPYTA
mmetsp:Transcript_6369/g.16459  ORF Transcript_6369/g.16459 Transcript_6369/m.16459 type:complete len:248 (+) Transcript_6369:327-1070(+)